MALQARGSAWGVRPRAKLMLPTGRVYRVAARGLGPSVPGFADADSAKQFALSIMGDLHIDPTAIHLYHQARDQLLQAMSEGGQPLTGARVVQLGDLGHSKHRSGSRECFETAKSYLGSFGVPSALVLGNHDLEGNDFETDEQNLGAWLDVFQQPHHWAQELGPAVLVGMSTVRFRSNANSHHEVFIDDAQIEWFEGLLKAHPNKPFVVFTHAPPIGCGLKVIQTVHIKNRCAYLNHSDRPERFMELVVRNPNVKLWFSGHFHLSHNYPDSVSTVGPAAFVQVGVCGEHNRDGFRQSRMLKYDYDKYELYTMDHETGGLRLDMTHAWADAAAPKIAIPEDELICDASSGWLCSQLDCKVGEDNAATRWLPVGRKSILAMQDGGLLVEYDMATSSPIGLLGKVAPGCEVRLLNQAGEPSTSADGSDVATVAVVDHSMGSTELYPRNEQGGFFRIYQPNKWRLKKAKEAAERAEADKAKATVVA